MSSLDPRFDCRFQKTIIINNGDSKNTIPSVIGTIGQLRFNKSTYKFEGYHDNEGKDIFNNIWRPLTQDVASASNLGIIRIGTNLLINPATGVLSSFAGGGSRIKQLIITVSPLLNAADFLTINDAIINVIGTPAGGYIDGSLTSNLGSPPSSTYPFIIQVAPGQYSEPLNQIVLPDYVSIRGEDNYNTVITQNIGNNDIDTGSMLVVGNNSEVRNLVITLADNANSEVSNAIYSNSKSNVVIDNCIFNCNKTITTTSNTYSIYMNNGNNNVISNSQFLINSTTLTGTFTGINVVNATPRIINNRIDILTPLATSTTGIELSNWNTLESIIDKTYIENLTLSNNNYNTVSGGINTGILLNNSPVILRNSEIEVANDPAFNTTNYGLQFNSDTPLITTTSTNVISFTNLVGVPNTIQSANTGSVNFVSLGFQHNQYIVVSGSSVNNGIYRIRSVVSSSVMTLESGFEVITELATINNTITLKALYSSDIQQSKINASTNTIMNGDDNSNSIFNLYNTQTQGGIYNIEPSFSVYTNFKTLTVGKQNCDFVNLGNAMSSIADNSYRTRYLIKIQSGIYQENSAVICKPYVNIEGNGENNTNLQFFQSDNTAGAPTSNSSCLLLASNMSIMNLTITNSSTSYIAGSTTTTVLYNPAPIEKFIMENIIINSNCSSAFNTGIYLVSALEPIFHNINIYINSNRNASYNTGIYNNLCSNFKYYNVSSTTECSISDNNHAINLLDSEGDLYNPSLIADSANVQNIGIFTTNNNSIQKLVQIYNGQIRANTAMDYSVYADDFYTFVCNNVQLLGDTKTNITSSRVFCSGCYTFNSAVDKYNITSLNSRGQNEQSSGTITIGDTAGKLDSTGLDNLIVGVNAGSSITSGSYTTILGSNAGNSITTANNNTLIGSSAGESITTGNFNTITGSNAGISITTGTDNTLMGSNVGISLTIGSTNTLIGSNCATSLTTGQQNTLIGYESGIYSTTANQNTFIGHSSGINNITGNCNTYLGQSAGFNNIIGNNNVLVGTETGFTNIANEIVAVGDYAGYNNLDTLENTYIGFQSGYNNNTGNCNTYLGHNAGYSNSDNLIAKTASFNSIIGSEAGYSLTSGSRNTLIGSVSQIGNQDSAGFSLTDGNDNIHIGVSSGYNATSAINNIMIGSSVGTNITTSSNNVLIGQNTANTLDTIGQNVIIGKGAGDVYQVGNGVMVGYQAGVGYTGGQAFALGYQAGSNIAGDFNMFVGYNSGGLPKTTTTGSNNLAIGPYSGFNLSSGSRNILIGSGDTIESVGRQLSTGSDNTLLGYKAGKAIQTGIGNTLIGSNAGASLTSGQDNLILGYQSGFNLNSGSYNITLGPQTGYNLFDGEGNIYSGYKAGYSTISGSYNINMGYETGYTGQVNNFNIHMGYQAGYKSLADQNLFLGYNAGINNTSGENNIFMGQNSGAGNNAQAEQIGDNNIFIGTNAGTSNNNGNSNIYMGANAGLNSLDGSKNIFIGENAGSQGTTSHNIFIGTASANTEGVGYQSYNAGQYNVFIGTDVGLENTQGSSNIFLGDKAGRDNTTGVQNIYIGTNAGQQANSITANYNIAIGSDAGINNLTGTENILIGKRVANLLTSTNYNNNIIIGSEAGQNIQQDNQIFIGTNAGKNNTVGNKNIFIGQNTGFDNVISNDNVIIGSDAGVSLVGSAGVGANTIIGTNAGHDLTTGINNIFLGSNSGATAINSANNVVIGAESMSLGNANDVIIIGNNAGKNNAADANIFIGSNAGVHNTSGLGNIFVGHQSGYEVVTSNGNIIFGNEASSTGRIADNNIILGNQTAKNVSNKGYFANNIIMGSNAGKTSNLAISSIMIGTNTVGLGTGGDVNIIMGNDTAVSVGNPNEYYVSILTAMTVSTNYVTINIPFGTGSHYFNYADIIIIESNINDYVFQSSIASILIDNLNNGNNGKTRLILNDYPTQTIPINSTLYSKNIKNNNIGPTDYSKSSSNMCIGDHNSYNLTTGSKNSSIGDNAMYENKVGRYNITLGTDSGYSVNTDNNLCLGIRAGYSLDNYKNNQLANDFTFYQSNNTITSTTINFINYVYGTVFDINGSSSNDSRYIVKFPDNTTPLVANGLVLQGFPNIKENGLINLSSGYTINSSEFTYVNYTFDVPEYNIVYNYSGGTSFGNFGKFGFVLTGINPNSYDYNILQYATHVTLSNSMFNDGIKNINTFIGGVIIFTPDVIIFPITQAVYGYDGIVSSNIVKVSINCVVYRNSITGNTFNTGIFSNDKFNVQVSKYSGLYKVVPDVPYFLENGLPYLTLQGTIIKEQLNNYSDLINQVYIKGTKTVIPIVNHSYQLYQNQTDSAFIAESNTLNIGPLIIEAPCLVYISGSQYNNGYNYVTQVLLINNVYTVFFDKNFPIKDEYIPIFNNERWITVIELQKNIAFGEIYVSNPSFAGNIINVKYRTDDYQNYTTGSYVIEKFYNNDIALNDNLLKYYSSNILVNTNMNITFCDNGIKTISNDYISSHDLIFQTSNISYSNITITNSTSTITTTIDYEFVNIVAPTLIKISGSTYNNGIYLVTKNNRPYKTLTIDPIHHSLVNETGVNIRIKTNCISSYTGKLELTYLQFNKQYTIYGSKYNDETKFTLDNDPYASSNASVYLNDNVSLINDGYNDYYYSIVNSPAANLAYGTGCNKGLMQHFSLSGITVSVINSTTLEFTELPFGPYNQHNLDGVVADTYLSLSNTPSGAYDGLYWISAITNPSTNIYRIVFNTKYSRGGVVYTTPDPFFGATFTTCNVLVNQFVFDNITNMRVWIVPPIGGGYNDYFPPYNLDWRQVITGYGDNAKFISFTMKDGFVLFNSGIHQPSQLFGSVSKNKSLTFEIASFALNTSQIAVALVESCPNQNAGYVDNGIRSYVINIGVPRPSTQTSDIYRKNLRPIIYSANNLIYIGDINCISNTTNNSLYIDGGYNQYYIARQIYGKTYLSPSFRSFYVGQIFYLDNFLNNGYYLIKSISSDYKTIYLDSTYSTLTTNYTGGGPSFYSQYTIYDANVDYSQMIPSTFVSNDYQLMLFKNPTTSGIKNDQSGFIDDTTLSELYFPLSNIDIIHSNANNLIINKADYDAPGSTIPPTKIIEICMNHTLLIPNDNLITNFTNVSFHNYTATGSSDISFYTSNNTIRSITTNLSSFLRSEYILVSGTVNNNHLYRINDSIAPTSNAIVISSEHIIVNENNKSAVLKANNINSANIVATDLSIFGGSQSLIITQTSNNNVTYTSNIASLSSYSIYCDSPNVITESPNFCIIEKSILFDETSNVGGISDITFNGSTILVSDNNINVDLSKFRTGQSLMITGTSFNNSNITISDSIIPSNISITTNETLTNETNTSALLSKNIDFTIVGEPVQSVISAQYSALYHYEDAEGNNSMIGSFAGHYLGSLNNANYNVAIGSKCSQVNHGSGNIFIGNESKLAANAQENATTYNNKFAVYKTNTTGVPSNPLIGGDFPTGRVGINTLIPEQFNLVSAIIVTDTKLIVNGGALANAFSPFTGCHIVFFPTSNVATSNVSTTSNVSIADTIKAGMIVSSTGKIMKSSVITTFCTVVPSCIPNDKCVFGVYSYNEQTQNTPESEYIIDANGNYVKNESYKPNMINLNYVAAIGEGCILITNYNGEIQNGDYITSSLISGYGMLQADDILHSYTVAKCTETIDWSRITDTILYNGQMYKTYFAGCTYHCG